MHDVEGPELVILMATFNGEQYITRQLESIKAQSYEKWCLLVSDDGSTDRTVELVSRFQDSVVQKVKVIQGPKSGFSRNFLYLLANAGSLKYYAFCDQDDIWHEDKLSRAVRHLSITEQGRPALYCSRTRLVDQNGTFIGFSPLFRRRPSFSNALVQSIAGGNTMVMNQAAKELVVAAGCKVNVPAHDWWAYLLVTGAGGIANYDKIPSLDYRQHQSNAVGAKASLLFRLKRLHSGLIREWSNANLQALRSCGQLLTRRNQEKLLYFEEARNASFPRNMGAIIRAGVYRQTLAGNVGLLAAILMGRV